MSKVGDKQPFTDILTEFVWKERRESGFCWENCPPIKDKRRFHFSTNT
ncbi:MULTISPECIES: hypothetical protein [Paenibacillus]|nr:MULTISPECIES: hypothetical protein [Paenibacillus]